jgi:hypothetical protein
LVGADAGAGEVGLDRGDVDDLAAAAVDHEAGDGSADEERAGEVGLQDAAPVGGVEVDERHAVLDAGVVDQDTHGPDLGLDRGHRLLHRGLVGDVERVRVHPAGASGPGERPTGLLEPVRVATVQHDRGPGPEQALGQRPPDAAARPGDERDRPGEVEEGGDAGDVLHAHPLIPPPELVGSRPATIRGCRP